MSEARAAYTAAVYPAGPDPTMTRSNLCRELMSAASFLKYSQRSY